MSVQSSPPARATQQQKELVKLLYVQHGSHKIASELSGVPYDLVRQWAVRGKWTKQDVSQSVTPSPVAVATANVESELAENERETRLSLARSTARLARKAERVQLKQSQHVKNVAQTAAIVHKWDSKQTQANVMVNIALLGVDPGEVQATVLESEA